MINYLRVPWDQAACRGLDTELFFIEEGNIAAAMQPTLREVCNSCPILDQCFDYAINESPTVYGFWAGTTTRDREKYRSSARKRAWREHKRAS